MGVTDSLLNGMILQVPLPSIGDFTQGPWNGTRISLLLEDKPPMKILILTTFFFGIFGDSF